ncbi:MAG: beta-glucosidase [Promethearchaeota archaeon]
MSKKFPYVGMNNQEIDEYVEESLNEMTLDEKIYVMSGHHFFRNMIKDKKFGVRAYSGGGVERLGVPPLMFTDGPRGVIIPGSTCFPVSMARGASWNINLEEQVGDVIGKEVRIHGGNLFGGVCINLLRHPAWGRAQETYGEDQFHIGRFGAALVRSVQKHNVMATIKHFAANSIEKSRFKVNILMNERTLREVYLPHFKYCIEEGCATVMSAYNKIRGEFCSHNKYLLRNILKEEWNFEGFVHSDWMSGIHDTIGGITGGLDVEMPRPKYYGKKLKSLVQNGQVSLDLINDAVRRVIKTTLKFTLKEDLQEYGVELLVCEEHVHLARTVAEQCMVLLKNEARTLPLDVDEIKTLAVIGKLANIRNTGDHGSSNVQQSNIVTPLQGLKNQYGNSIDILYSNGKDLEQAKRLAQKADAVVVIAGFTHKDEGEYIPQKLQFVSDRASLSLKTNEIKLINNISEINSRCIVALVGGSAITMEEWRDNVPAILMAWYSGMEGGNALADIIFGKVNPSGKLPFSIPKDPAHLPYFERDIEEIEYGYFHGYSLLEKEIITPAFPFGFGLSYSEFEYENLKVSTSNGNIIINVEVTNTSSIPGEEVVQLYVGFKNSKIVRPKKLLKGFKKVKIMPQEIKIVEINVNKQDFAYYNPESKQWEIEDITYEILIGPSSNNTELLKAEISL